MLSPLRVNPCDRHTLSADAKPIFLLGDTAWELLHRLTRSEILYYLDKRAEQGFNLVCTVVLAEFDGLRVPNAEGQLPLIDEDPTRLNEAYFELVDFFIAQCHERGIYVGLLPSWGDKMTAPWGIGPRIFHIGHEHDCHEYGRLLGRRYRTATNLLWILGGDRPANLSQISLDWPYPWKAGFTPETNWEPLWRAMADGIRAEVLDAVIAYHPQGGSLSTSQLLSGAEWLDINMLQSGHGGGRDVPVWDLIERDHAVEPPKPTLDVEPNYEDHLVNPWPTWDPTNGRFDDYDVRKQCYRSVFAGGCGVVYGNHAVWQFWKNTREPIMMPLCNWREALERPGAIQIGFLKRLMDAFGNRPRVPDNSIILSGLGERQTRRVAIRSADGELAYVYMPTADEIVVRAPVHGGEFSSVSWICPRTREIHNVGLQLTPGQDSSLLPPSDFGPDVVLRLARAG